MSLNNLARCLLQDEQVQQALEICTEPMEIAVDPLKREPGYYAILAAMIQSLYLELCEANQVEPDVALLVHSPGQEIPKAPTAP